MTMNWWRRGVAAAVVAKQEKLPTFQATSQDETEGDNPSNICYCYPGVGVG